MERRTTVLVVDMYPIVRWAIEEFLAGQADFVIVGAAGSIAEATSLVRSLAPDVVITDLLLPDGNVAESMTSFTDNGSTHILAYSEHDSWDHVEAFLNAGGSGFLSKRSPLDELILALRATADGRRWVSPTLRKVDATHDEDSRHSPLSAREMEIAALVAKGLTSKQIGGQLCLSTRTVDNHRHRIFKKLKIRHCTQLADYAAKQGLS